MQSNLPFVGLLMDRFGRRKVVLAGPVLLAMLGSECPLTGPPDWHTFLMRSGLRC